MHYSSYPRINAAQLLNLPTQSKLQYLENYLSKSSRYSEARDVLEYILRSESEPHQYELISSLLQKMAQKPSIDLRFVLGQVDHCLEHCKTFQAFIVLVRYMLVYQATISTHTLEISYNSFARKYKFYEKQIVAMEGKNLAEYSRIVEAVKMGMQMMPKLYLKLNRNIDTTYLSNLLEWVLVCPAASVDDCRIIQRYCRFIAQECIDHKVAGDAFDCTQTRRLLRLVMEKSVLNYEGAQNLCFILQSLNDMVISSAISSNLQDFTQFPAQMYLNCFNTLVRASMGPRTLRFFICISNALKEEYQFHVLKLLYQEFVINKLVRYYKFTSTAQVQIQDLVSLYVYGFINKISADTESVKYFLTDFRLLTKKQMSFWLEMAVIIAYEQPAIQRAIMPIINQITPMRTLQQIVSQLVYQNQKKHAWRFLDKDLKDKKKYKLTPSPKSGIINENVNCYIITVMQAFFMSKVLPSIVRNYEPQYTQRGFYRNQIKLPLLYELNTLFDNLRLQIKNVTIDAIKKVGPEDFRDPMQQDCQHYLNEFFESVGKEIDLIAEDRARREFQQKFKDAFQIVIKNQRVCQSCGNKSENQMECFIHSIDYTEVLAEEWESTLEDYTCDKCKHKGNQKEKSRIVKFPQIIILHIKRFHFDKDLGEVKKLEEANIIRKFQNYQLQGFISHIGSQVRCGHYILYYKSPDHPLTWLLFDDKRVHEFKIDTQDERFEANFKSENTPYIVIYKRTSGK